MNKALIVTVVIIFTVVFSVSCSKDGSGGGGTTTVDCNTVSNKAFVADINPIIQASCNLAGCHASGSINGPGGLTNYLQVSAAASSVKTAISSGRMPQGSTLTTAQKNSIICWVNSGSPNN